MAERIKRHSYDRDFTNQWFWRSTSQKEIDIVEEADGGLSACEIKWNPAKANVRIPIQFRDAYPDTPFKVITPDNIEDLL